MVSVIRFEPGLRHRPAHLPPARRLAEVWSVDAEHGMTEVVRARASASGTARVRTITVAAEEPHAEPGGFELIVIGKAFHRLPRALVAQRAYGRRGRPRTAGRSANSPAADGHLTETVGYACELAHRPARHH
jgi:hypothetical protein